MDARALARTRADNDPAASVCAVLSELAAKSGRAAYKMALANTGAVLVKTSKGTLVERKADGSKRVIKTLPSGKRVKVGLVLKRAKPEVPKSRPDGGMTAHPRRDD